MAPKKAGRAAASKGVVAVALKKGAAKKNVTYDYSELEEGVRVQAKSDGVYYAAEVVAVSTSKSHSKAPVKISFKGYDSSYNEWVSGDRLRSKTIKKVTPEAEKRPPLEFNFGYWKIRGLGSIFRMVFEYKGVKYTDNQYAEPDDWFGKAKPGMLEKTPLANLPYVECGSDVVCQTNACLSYIGNKLRLNGGGYKARLLNEQLLCEIYDVRNTMIELVYPHKTVCRDAAEHTTKAKKHCEGNPFSKFEKILDKVGTDYFCGESPCTSDFHIWEMLDQHRLLAEKLECGDIFKDIPKCKAFYDRFRAIPSLQKYFESADYKLPVNFPAGNAYFL